MSENETRQPETFSRRDLAGALFRECDLSGARMRGAFVDDMDIEAPWLLEGEARLLVNGVDVVPFVRAELDRRFPGRQLKDARDPEGLRTAWQRLEEAWDAAIARARTLPEGTVDVSVGGEWSFSQTLRHLVMAIDTWLVGAVQRVAQPYHPLGQPHAEYALDGYDTSVFTTEVPTFDAVLEALADRRTRVRKFLAQVTSEELEEARPNPWGPEHQETVGACVRTILEEGWEHLRYALRDLDAIEAGRA